MSKPANYSLDDLIESPKREPRVPLQNETFKHRMVMALMAQGRTQKEVAQITGFSEVWVSQICRQPWFRKNLVAFINEHASDALNKILENQAIPSVLTLVSIRDSEEASASVRVNAANSLLDRFLGKPTQKIEGSFSQKEYDAETLDRELREVESELARVGSLEAPTARTAEEETGAAEG